MNAGIRAAARGVRCAARGLASGVALSLALCVAPEVAAARAGVDLWKERPRSAADCDALVRDHPRDFEAWRCYNVIGIVHGAWDDALRGLRAQVAVHPDEPRARLFLGVTLRDHGEAREAEDHLVRAAAGLAREGAHDGETHARLALAFDYRDAGRHDLADVELKRAIDACARTGDRALAALVAREQGVHAGRRGQWAEAYRHYERGRALLDTDDPAVTASPMVRSGWVAGLILDGFARVALELGRQREALELYSELAARQMRQHNLHSAATSLYNVALAKVLLDQLGDIERSETLAAIDAALDVSIKAGVRRDEAYARLLRSRFLPPAERFAELDRAEAIGVATNSDSVRGWAAIYRAQAFESVGNSAAAGRESERAVGIVPDRTGKVQALALAGFHAWENGARDAAATWWTRAFEATEALRESQRNDTFGAEMFSARSTIYHHVAGWMLHDFAQRHDHAQLERAFDVMERQRARWLRTSGDSRRPTLAEVQSALADDQAVLAYQLPATQSAAIHPERLGGWVVAITRSRVDAIAIPARRDVEDRIALYLGLSARGDADAERAAARIHADVLGEALRAMPAGIRRLVIVADGPLHRLPFAALSAAAGAPVLGETYDIANAPSVTAFWRLRTASQAAPATAAVPGSGGRVLAMADPPLGPALDAANTLRAATLDGHLALPALPNARDEARDLLRTFGGAGEAHTGASASEHFLKTASLAGISLLHFATHAVIDERHPDRSALLLAGGGGEDGLLRPQEIEALDLAGKVVVLSACRSAAGRVLEGEGPMSLARAFFRAGARAVVGSLWPLRDDEQRRIGTALARELARGAPVAAALAAAQREARAAGEPVSAWAGLVVLGDGDVVPFPGGAVLAPSRPRRDAVIAVCGGLAALAALTVLVRRRRR